MKVFIRDFRKTTQKWANLYDIFIERFQIDSTNATGEELVLVVTHIVGPFRIFKLVDDLWNGFT